MWGRRSDLLAVLGQVAAQALPIPLAAAALAVCAAALEEAAKNAAGLLLRGDARLRLLLRRVLLLHGACGRGPARAASVLEH